jgi:hypothetical protein
VLGCSTLLPPRAPLEVLASELSALVNGASGANLHESFEFLRFPQSLSPPLVCPVHPSSRRRYRLMLSEASLAS